MFGQTITNYHNTPKVVCHSRSRFYSSIVFCLHVVDSDCGTIIGSNLCCCKCQGDNCVRAPAVVSRDGQAHGFKFGALLTVKSG